MPAIKERQARATPDTVAPRADAAEAPAPAPAPAPPGVGEARPERPPVGLDAGARMAASSPSTVTKEPTTPASSSGPTRSLSSSSDATQDMAFTRSAGTCAAVPGAGLTAPTMARTTAGRPPCALSAWRLTRDPAHMVAMQSMAWVATSGVACCKKATADRKSPWPRMCVHIVGVVPYTCSSTCMARARTSATPSTGASSGRPTKARRGGMHSFTGASTSGAPPALVSTNVCTSCSVHSATCRSAVHGTPPAVVAPPPAAPAPAPLPAPPAAAEVPAPPPAPATPRSTGSSRRRASMRTAPPAAAEPMKRAQRCARARVAKARTPAATAALSKSSPRCTKPRRARTPASEPTATGPLGPEPTLATMVAVSMMYLQQGA